MIKLYFQYYVLFSLFIFVLILIDAKFGPKKQKDVFESLKEMQEDLDRIKSKSPKLANLLEYMISEEMNGNNLPILIVGMTICLLPFARLYFLYLTLKGIFFGKGEED